MTRTDNLHLCTWVGSDPVSMEEMNENFRTLDAAGGRSNALFEPLLWNTAGALLDSMELGATGQYAEGLLADVLNGTGKLTALTQLYIGGGSAECLPVQGMTQCGINAFNNGSQTQPNITGSGCRKLSYKSDQKFGPDEVEIMTFTPYNFYHATSFTLGEGSAVHMDNCTVRLTDDEGNTLFNTPMTLLGSGNNPATVQTDILLSPNKTYHLYAKTNTTTSTQTVALTKEYFRGTEVAYSGGTFKTIQIAVPAGCTRARVMMRVASPADISVKLSAGSSQITMQKSVAEDDVVPKANTSCKLLRCSCALPQGCAQAAIEVTLGSASAKVYDYALIFV